MEWLDVLDAPLALKNCHTDILGDWYRDPWGWPELDWVVTRRPELLVATLGRSDARRLARIDVPKENFGTRPAVVLHPLDRLAYQALVDRISVDVHGDLRPWVFGWRLPRGEPTRGRYVPNDKEWLYYRKRLQVLAARHPVALKSDIVSFFASISIQRLHERVRSRISDGVVAQLFTMLSSWARTRDRPGLPQRCLASSVLANFYLGPLDDTIEQSAPSAAEGESVGAARWMDDLWLFGDDRGAVRAGQQRLERTIRDLEMNMGAGKTEVLDGDALRQAAWAIEHGSVDAALAMDPLSMTPLAQLVDQIVAAPEVASRTNVRFATTRIRDAGDGALARKLSDEAHRMPQGADYIARMLRELGSWPEKVDWYVEYASSAWGAASEWGVAQLGTMFPASADDVASVAGLFKERLPMHPSLPFVAVAAHRLAAWQPTAARDLLRAVAPRAADPLERRILALAALGAGEDRTLVARMLEEFEENQVTLLMLQDRHFQPIKANPDFAG